MSQSVVDQAQTKVDELSAQFKAAESELVASTASLTVSRHRLVGAEAEIARAKENLSYTTITSPIDGIVTRVNAKVGELVVTGTMNNPGTTILEDFRSVADAGGCADRREQHRGGARGAEGEDAYFGVSG